MSKSLSEIQKPISEEIKRFETIFKDSMASRVVLLDKIMGYIVRRKGKQIRPMLVFLASKTCGTVTDKTYRGASLIELLHTATLVHDDVVDDSGFRRGFFSVNALWKNKIAVLVGDYLLSKGLLLSIDNGDFELLKIVSEAVRKMSEGELLQMEKARLLDISEAVYYEIIEYKTASLISSCCMVGASAGGADLDAVARMGEFGTKVGMAFQIKDDLFDYGDGEIGKPVGIDIKEKKMTLPLIYALARTDAGTKKRIINLVRNESENSKKVKEVIAFVLSVGGLEAATEVMLRYIDEAKAILHTFPESIYRSALEDLVDFTIARNN